MGWFVSLVFKVTNHRELHQFNEPAYRKNLMTTSSLNPPTVIMAFHQGRGVQEGENLSSPAVDHRHAHDLVTTVWRTAVMAPFHAQSHTAAVTLRHHWQGFGSAGRISGLQLCTLIPLRS